MADQLSNDLASLRIARDDGPPSSGWLRRLVLLAVLGIAGAAAWIYGKPLVEAKVLRPEVDVTQIVVVTPAEAQAKLTSTGYVVPQRLSRVGARVPGRIKEMHVREGQVVAAGDVLAQLEAADQRALLNTARARLLAAKAQVQTAKAELADAQQQAKRERALVQRGVGQLAAAEDLEFRALAVQKQVAAAEANVKAVKAEVDAIEVNLADYTITAPMDGTVVAKPAQVGELVGVQASALVELADFGSLMVETDVPEGRLHLVQLEDPCQIVLDAYPTRTYRGRVEQITPKVNRAKATVTVKVRFDGDAQGVLPDMAARVSFLTGEPDPALADAAPKVIVPAAAIDERNGSTVVFVLDDDTVRMQTVELGETVGSGFELLAGPQPGATVVREPPSSLEDGQKVERKDQAS
ncbi:efflux RND transporter periplasmic adaptor subunit [Paraliomyxa miuraensis]|uniref:efflux RND transporter periplasmic adaptor subunit n=1 Tax=Paraliomyxa miuraensis TaxID=376150 RepID=UPI0022586888|nr:efflux RND transporter periplasmic adaptor subunit [Paraliomyxa miuraensis]MCX4243608.1 efflux RND transporter periplasmic adaptor subunit [Paraliomyxa miuraensis]